MSILAAMTATEARYQQREAQRSGQLADVPYRNGLEAGESGSPWFFARGLQAARAVGRLQVRDDQGNEHGRGTAFLVSPRLLLTTQQLLPSPAHAIASRVEFDEEESISGVTPASTVVALAPEQLFLSDAALDYTLVAVVPDPSLAPCGWLPLIEEPGPLRVGDRLSLIQHADGEAKQLVIRQTLVLDVFDPFLVYRGDSATATSGAPLFNDQWEVVGWHHSGVAKRNDQGDVLNQDAIPWNAGMGEQRIAWLAQEGVRVSALVRHIRNQVLPAEAESLRQELLEAIPPPMGTPDGAKPLPGEVWLPEQEPATLPPPVEEDQTVVNQTLMVAPPLNGTATWTIPLRVSLSFGAPVLEGATPAMEATADGMLERWSLFGSRPPAAPAPMPAASAPVTMAAGSADFRLASLAATSFDWQTSLSLCLASELAYKSAAEVKAQARVWGFSDGVFVEKGAAQGFLAWSATLAMVAFRGTESTADWLSNLHLTSSTLPGVGRVHTGFLEQFKALRPALESLLIGRSGLPLLVTGHSLGGAIALVAAASWAATRPVRALYTYGQPAVAADKGTAAAINAALTGRYHRLVNDADIVPRVPPGFRHGGHLLRFDRRGRVTSQEPPAVSGPSGTRGLGDGDSPSTLEGEPMLTGEEFETLQGELRMAVATRNPAGTRGLIGDHMLPGYLSRIRQQLS
jgi:hypothetical protein